MVKFNFGINPKDDNQKGTQPINQATQIMQNTSSAPTVTISKEIPKTEPVIINNPPFRVDLKKEEIPVTNIPQITPAMKVPIIPQNPQTVNIQLKDKTTLPAEPSPKKFEIKTDSFPKKNGEVIEEIKENIVQSNPNEIFPRKGVSSNANLTPSFSIKKKEDPVVEEKKEPVIAQITPEKIPTPIITKIKEEPQNTDPLSPLETIKKDIMKFKKQKESEIAAIEKEINDLENKKEEKIKEKNAKEDEIKKKSKEFTKMIDEIKTIAGDLLTNEKKAA